MITAERNETRREGGNEKETHREMHAERGTAKKRNTAEQLVAMRSVLAISRSQ